MTRCHWASPGNGHGPESRVPLGDGFLDGGALSAHPEAVAGILHVAPYGEAPTPLTTPHLVRHLQTKPILSSGQCTSPFHDLFPIFSYSWALLVTTTGREHREGLWHPPGRPQNLKGTPLQKGKRSPQNQRGKHFKNQRDFSIIKGGTTPKAKRNYSKKETDCPESKEGSMPRSKGIAQKSKGRRPKKQREHPNSKGITQKEKGELPQNQRNHPKPKGSTTTTPKQISLKSKGGPPQKAKREPPQNLKVQHSKNYKGLPKTQRENHSKTQRHCPKIIGGATKTQRENHPKTQRVCPKIIGGNTSKTNWISQNPQGEPPQNPKEALHPKKKKTAPTKRLLKTQSKCHPKPQGNRSKPKGTSTLKPPEITQSLRHPTGIKANPKQSAPQKPIAGIIPEPKAIPQHPNGPPSHTPKATSHRRRSPRWR